MIGILKAVQGFKRLSGILGWVGGGLYKRIDENRELMELLRREAPDLVAQHPEIANWLQAHDDFFCELESAMPPSDMRFGPRQPMPGSEQPGFPRSWPGGDAESLRRQVEVVSENGKNRTLSA